MLKLCIIFSALCLLTIGCYVMFKPDLSDLGVIPVVATNPETASEFRSLFAGSFIAYAYLLIRFAYSYKAISIGLCIAYIMSFIAVGRLVSFFMRDLIFLGSLFLLEKFF